MGGTGNGCQRCFDPLSDFLAVHVWIWVSRLLHSLRRPMLRLTTYLGSERIREVAFHRDFWLIEGGFHTEARRGAMRMRFSWKHIGTANIPLDNDMFNPVDLLPGPHSTARHVREESRPRPTRYTPFATYPMTTWRGVGKHKHTEMMSLYILYV